MKYLKPIQKKYAKVLFDLLRDSEITKTIQWDGPKDFASFQRDLGIFEKEVINNLRHMFVIIEKESNSVAGCADIRPTSGNFRATIGLWIGHKFQNRGLGKEVIKELTRYGFTDLNLQKIEAYIFVGNESSRRVFEKCKYSLEGIIRSRIKKNGKFVDEWLYGIIKDDFFKKYSSNTHQALHQLSLNYLENLSGNRLTSFLLQVFQNRSNSISPHSVLKSWEKSRFFRLPIEDRKKLIYTQSLFIEKANEFSFQYIDLPPVCPFGTVSSVSPVSQNNILSSVRGTEVISDSTNVLALEAASRRKKYRNSLNFREKKVKLSSAHKLVRAQALPGPNFYAHFEIFSMVTSGRTKNNSFFEEELIEHIKVYVKALDIINNRLDIVVVLYTENNIIAERVLKILRSGGIKVTRERKRPSGNNYYRKISFNINTFTNNEIVNLADGGLVDWTAKLLSDKKENLMISGIGITRVLQL